MTDAYNVIRSIFTSDSHDRSGPIYQCIYNDDSDELEYIL